MVRRLALSVVGVLLLHGTAAAQSADGKVLFTQRCGVCHTLNSATPSILAPHLAGVGGRKAGSVEGFRYSKALSGSSIVWSEATLEQFLSAPGKMVPGTRMAVSIPDAKQRTAIVRYLVGQRK